MKVGLGRREFRWLVAYNFGKQESKKILVISPVKLLIWLIWHWVQRAWDNLWWAVARRIMSISRRCSFILKEIDPYWCDSMDNLLNINYISRKNLPIVNLKQSAEIKNWKSSGGQWWGFHQWFYDMLVLLSSSVNSWGSPGMIVSQY